MAGLLNPRSYVIVTETDHVTVTPTPVGALPSTPTTMMDTPLISSSGLTIPSPLTSAFPTSTSTSITRSTPLPTSTTIVLPTYSPTPRPNFNDTFAILTLVAIILSGVLLLTLLGYMIYLRCRGECPKCKQLKGQMDMWERGDLKRITKEMVKKRETLLNAGGERDLEMGVDDEDDEVTKQAARAAALAMLEGTSGNEAWKAFSWEGMKEVFMCQGKNEARADSPTLPPTHASNIDGDRFFTVPVEHTPAALPSRYEPGDNRLYDPPSPSAYSQATNVNGVRTFAEYGEDGAGGANDGARGSYQMHGWRRGQREV